MNPKISVLMSVYNDELYVKESIDSILHQTFENFEFIIINDGSTDKSIEILEEFSDKDNRIILVNKKNEGLTKALNRGLRLAKGLYIARQDSNDISHPERFAKQFNFMENNCEMVVCWPWFNVIDKNGSVIGKFEFAVKNKNIKKKLLQSSIFPHSASFYRKKEILSCGGYREIFKKSQDRDLWLRLIENHKVGGISEILFSYRYLLGSITVSDDSDQRIYSRLALEAYKYRNRYGDDKDFISSLLIELKELPTPKYSRNNLFLANLHLRSGKNYNAFQLFKTELLKGYSKNLILKLLMSLIPINWSKLYRLI